MKETKRNVSWHAGEDISMEQAESIIFDSDGMLPEMTLHSCLLLTFSHGDKKKKKKRRPQPVNYSLIVALWMVEQQTVYIHYYRFLLCCFGAQPKLRVPCCTVKT